MAAENAADRSAFVHGDGFGVSATYTPSGGAASTINVILDQPHTVADIGELGALDVAYRARVRADDVAAPAAGDSLVVGSQTFTVRGFRQDVSGDFWMLDLELQ